MKEAVFLKQNKQKWEKLEAILEGKEATTPDELSESFIQLTDDLSFSRTFYPKSNTTKYLNNLLYLAHQKLYKNKKERGSRIALFWKQELPILMYEHRKQFLYAFLIFWMAALVGVVSSAHDDTFVRLILGDQYVNKTIENIQNGEPMAIYASQEELGMFLGITFNNIKVAFNTFIAGIFLSFGTGLLLFYNGIMLGAFQYFFYQKGFLLTSVLTVWAHGTLEISAIIIAGAAGLVMGNSILFPGTFTRLQSFKKGAKNGLKIAIGLIPIFFMAGFIEGFITRHVPHIHVFAGATIIIVSLTFIVWYFILYPRKIYKTKSYEGISKN